MRATPPMPDEIRAGFYPDFERGWRRAELIGRSIMLVAVAGTLAGLLGGGPVNFWTRTVSAEALTVDFSPIVRFGTPTGLTIRIRAAPGQDRVAVTLPPSIIKAYALQSVFPQPLEWSSDAQGDVRMIFSVSPGAHEVVVQVGGMPASAGLMRLSAWQDGAPPAAWSQLVLP